MLIGQTSPGGNGYGSNVYLTFSATCSNGTLFTGNASQTISYIGADTPAAAQRQAQQQINNQQAPGGSGVAGGGVASTATIPPSQQCQPTCDILIGNNPLPEPTDSQGNPVSPNRVNPGVFVPVDNRDDNANGILDSQENTPFTPGIKTNITAVNLTTTGENGKLQLSTTGAGAPGSSGQELKILVLKMQANGTQMLQEAQGSDLIWNWPLNKGQTATVYLEGVNPSASLGDIGLTLNYKSNVQEKSAQDNATVTVVDLDINEVSSDQNYNPTEMGMPSYNFFLNQQPLTLSVNGSTVTDATAGTGQGTGAPFGYSGGGDFDPPLGPNRFLTMGFGSDKNAHVKVLLDDSTLLASLKSKILVEFVANAPSSSAPTYGPGASFANQQILSVSGMDIASLSWSGPPGMSSPATTFEPDPSDWNIVVGIDSNGDGILEPSEIVSTTKYGLRVVNPASYASAVNWLTAFDYGALFAPDWNHVIPSEYLHAFLTNTQITGSDSPPTTVNITSSETWPNLPQEIEINVGAVFDVTGAATIPNYTFGSDSAISDEIGNSEDFLESIINQVFQSSDFIQKINASLQPHAGASGTYQFPYPVPIQIIALGNDNDPAPDLTDPELKDALHNVTLGPNPGQTGFLITATVDIKSQAIVALHFQGIISDIDEFHWVHPSQVGTLGGKVTAWGMTAQSGYNSLITSSTGAAGQIFESKIAIDAIYNPMDDVDDEGYNVPFLPYPIPPTPAK